MSHTAGIMEKYWKSQKLQPDYNFFMIFINFHDFPWFSLILWRKWIFSISKIEKMRFSIKHIFLFIFIIRFHFFLSRLNPTSVRHWKIHSSTTRFFYFSYFSWIFWYFHVFFAYFHMLFWNIVQKRWLGRFRSYKTKKTR